MVLPNFIISFALSVSKLLPLIIIVSPAIPEEGLKLARTGGRTGAGVSLFLLQPMIPAVTDYIKTRFFVYKCFHVLFIGLVK
jgi:hypothetical protein